MVVDIEREERNVVFDVCLYAVQVPPWCFKQSDLPYPTSVGIPLKAIRVLSDK